MSFSDQVPTEILDLARSARRVTVLTGAGMSAESGVPTFRDAQTGLWERFDPAELATPGAWEEDPAQCWAWYAWRASLMRGAEPHPGHLALAQWQARPGLVCSVRWADSSRRGVVRGGPARAGVPGLQRGFPKIWDATSSRMVIIQSRSSSP